jgi:predicted type IV restriction endonuclease
MNHDYDHSNEVFFRLGWLEDKRTADTCLSDLAKRAERLKGEGVFELDTIAIFVEPLLRGLGWDTLDHDQVDRAPGGNYPDFELFGRGKRMAVVEVKSLETGDRYLQKNAYEQLYGYALERLRRLPKQDWVVMLRDQPIVCGVVTNGRSWQVYDFHGERQDLKCEFDLQRNPDKRMLVASLGRLQLLARLGI